ncbi:hypothetical protein Lal_00001696 [Lupinus albus]|nr:hypothetical protein Lal_00001696 [Lupinus albus]
MITRSNLAEQLRQYQIRSKHDWASVSFFSSTSSSSSSFFTTSSSRVDVVVFVIWEIAVLAFLVLSVLSLFFKHNQLAFILVCITVLLLLCMKVTKHGVGYATWSIGPTSHSSLDSLTPDSTHKVVYKLSNSRDLPHTYNPIYEPLIVLHLNLMNSYSTMTYVQDTYSGYDWCKGLELYLFCDLIPVVFSLV